MIESACGFNDSTLSPCLNCGFLYTGHLLTGIKVKEGKKFISLSLSVPLPLPSFPLSFPYTDRTLELGPALKTSSD